MTMPRALVGSPGFHPAALNVVCVTPLGLKAQNSASDLARQMVSNHAGAIDVGFRRGRQAESVGLWSFFLRRIFSRKPADGRFLFYYQLSNPLVSLAVSILALAFRAHLTVHLLDDFLETPKYRRFLGLPRTISLWTMRKADQALTICPAMRDGLLDRYGISSSVAFRWRPVVSTPRPDVGNGRVIFGGAINDRTNYKALESFAAMLRERHPNIVLDVFSRGGNKRFGEMPNVTLCEPLGEAEFVKCAKQYDAFLIPFNDDESSIDFYRLSLPSKASSIFEIQIPLILHAPEVFWFARFLKKFEFSATSIDDIGNRRSVASTVYEAANDELGSLCEVHSLRDIPSSPRRAR